MIVGWQLLWQASIADKKLRGLFDKQGAASKEEKEILIQENSDAAFYYGKIEAAKFFANSSLILSPGKAEVIKNADISAVEIPEVSFAQC